jgi:hypothetical protein
MYIWNFSITRAIQYEYSPNDRCNLNLGQIKIINSYLIKIVNNKGHTVYLSLNFLLIFSRYLKMFSNDDRTDMILLTHYFCDLNCLFPSTTRRHGNFAGVHTLLRMLLSSFYIMFCVNGK